MNNPKIIDHLFRHQYGKMVSILTRIFGLEHLQIVEDAVQDTFYKAVISWRNKLPENPEAWLTKSAKNRVIDIFRKITADTTREQKLYSGTAAIAIQEVFQDSEIEDSQLRMIFTACHPSLKPVEQITFALKTISGFSTKEIASALLTKQETIKKRLARARKKIKEENIAFEIPQGQDLILRMARVHEIIYLIFNEGYHSNKESELVRLDLLAEAMRLCTIILDKKLETHTTSCALYALMCFHAARVESKIGIENQLVDLKNQDRSKWNGHFILLGHKHMYEAVETDHFSSYHYEAAIAAEHVKVNKFEDTDWKRILMWYQRLYDLLPTVSIQLNIAIVHLQLNEFEAVSSKLRNIKESDLGQRKYLYHGTWAEYYKAINNLEAAKVSLKNAFDLANNTIEKEFIANKMEEL